MQIATGGKSVIMSSPSLRLGIERGRLRILSDVLFSLLQLAAEPEYYGSRRKVEIGSDGLWERQLWG